MTDSCTCGFHESLAAKDAEIDVYDKTEDLLVAQITELKAKLERAEAAIAMCDGCNLCQAYRDLYESGGSDE